MKIKPEFKDDRDKIIAFTTILTSMFFIFFPPLIVVFFAKEYISESTYSIAKAFLNFELLLFIISLVFLIPILGWILKIIFLPILIIFNVIVIIINLLAMAKNTEINVPVSFEFI